jgi:hypothetical protein
MTPGPGAWDPAAEAAVPEQVADYVCAVGGSRPCRLGACVGYEIDGHLVLVGYPLHDPRDESALNAAVEQGLTLPGLRRITVIGPARPPQAPPDAPEVRDEHVGLPVPPPAARRKLRSLLRRAAREVTIAPGRELGPEHATLVGRYLEERALDAGTRYIFGRIGHYLGASATAQIVSARRGDGRLAAFSVGEFASRHTGFFMFSFRDPDLAPPGSADLLLAHLLEEARARGQTRMNLGLGVNAGVAFFKRKWGAEPFLPYVEVSWGIVAPPRMTRLGRWLGFGVRKRP